MGEADRIARLIRQVFEGYAYHGPSLMRALGPVSVATARRKRAGQPHSIWEIVAHLTAELQYARAVIDGTAGKWVAGKTTWPPVLDTSDEAWSQAIRELRRANRGLVMTVKGRDDAFLHTRPGGVRGTFYLVLHGTLHHTVFHAGEISLLATINGRRG